MDGAHAKFAPSSLGRVVQCPGSCGLAVRYPEPPDSPEAMEGQAAHWVAQEMLLGRNPQAGGLAPNGAYVDQEMIDAAEEYASHIEVRGRLGHVEQALRIPQIHPECWGTPDHWAADFAGRVIYVDDFKYGHGYVSEFENWQLMAYACGAIDSLGLDGHGVQDWRLELTIVQPRCYSAAGSVRTWKLRATDLRGYVNRMRAACEEAAGMQPRLSLGPSCRHCPARHACPSLHVAAAGACDEVRRATPLDLPPQALGVELHYLHRAAELLSARISGLEEQAKVLLRQGKPVPNYSLVQGTGRRRWSKPVTEILAFGELMGVDLSKEPAAKTPAQAAKLGIDETVISAYSEVPAGELKLTADTTAITRRIFNNG